MGKSTWVQWLLAAVLVLVAGTIIVAADERIEVKVEKHGDQQVTVDINGVVEVVGLDDLADGESRRFDVGDHELVITRVGDELEVISQAEAFEALGHHAGSPDTMVWVTAGGEEIEIGDDCGQGEKKLIVMKVVGKDSADGESKTYTIELDGDELVLDGERRIEIDEIATVHGGQPHAVVITESGGVEHPVILKSRAAPGGMVKYRCEETGSVLLLNKDEAVADSYICPATGCLMTRVEEPEVQVIKIKKSVETVQDDR